MTTPVLQPNMGAPSHPAAASQQPGAALEQITIASRIPEFWPDQPRVWFVRLESTINQQRLSDLARYDLVITKLNKEIIGQVTDILVKPPDTNKYEMLKERLLTIFEESASRQVQKLIGEMELGDQRPSQLLRRMRNLAQERVPDETLTVLWQSHLPTAIKAVLAVADAKDLDVLAKIADKVLENTSMGAVQVAETTENPGKAANGTDALLGQLAKINLRLSNLERGRSRQKNRSGYDSRASSRNSRSQSRSGSDRKSGNWLCFYHFRYRERAVKCVEPCNWKGEKVNKQPEN